MKNLKLCFFFLLSPFLLLSSFCLFSFNQPSVFVVPTLIAQNPNDDRIKLNKDLGDDYINLKFLIASIFFGIKQAKAIKGEKEYTYPVDLLAVAITQLMLEQDKVLGAVDLDKIKGPPRQQLLNLLDAQGKLKHYQTLVTSGWNQLSKVQEVQNIIKPYLLKMKVLGISKVVHPSSKLSFKFLKLDEISVNQLRYNFMPTFGLEYKTALTFSINKSASPYLHALQKAFGFSLSDILVGSKKVAVSSLVNSQVQEASNLSLPDLAIIQKLQPLGLEKLQTQVQAQINSQLDAYKTSIQLTLGSFAFGKITKIKIKAKTYQVGALLTAKNLQLTGAKLPQNAKDQLSVLFKNGITQTQLDTALTAILKTKAVAATSSQTQKSQTPKTPNQKKLIIGLSVGGGVLTLSALGGFLYWFFKIKK